MRSSLLALATLVALVALSGVARARPAVAIAPLEGDRGGAVADVVADVAGKLAKVTSPGETERAMQRMDLSADLDGKGIRKLRKRLGVDALIHGKVRKAGGKRTLELEVSVRGKRTDKFELTFKSPTSARFKRELRDELRKRIAKGEGADDDDDDDRKAKSDRKAKRDDDDRKAKRDDDDRKAKNNRKTRRDDDDDDDDRKGRKNKRRRRGSRDDDEVARNPLTQAAARISAGGAFTRRTLNYDSAAPMPPQRPQRVGTISGSARVEGELYPGSFSTLKGPAAAVGVAFEIDKTLGLGVGVPGTAVTAPIDKLHLAIGARYRFVFGTSSVALGASYYRRRYIADRSGLATPGTLDMPDVDYTAVAVGATGRFAASAKIGAFVGLDVPLLLSAGPIQKADSYGPADILAVELDAGVDYQVADHYAIRAAAELSNFGLTFGGKPGTQAATRLVSKATDRNVGITVTFEVVY